MPIQRDARRDRGALHPGKRGGTGEELLLERMDLLRLLVPVLREHRLRHQHPCRIAEARPDAEEPRQRPDHQSGADYQHQRERDLGDDQRGPGAAAAGGARGTVLQRLHKIGTAGVERGSQTREEPGADRHGEGETEHRPVESHLVEARDGPRRERDQAVQSPRR